MIVKKKIKIKNEKIKFCFSSRQVCRYTNIPTFMSGMYVRIMKSYTNNKLIKTTLTAT